MSWSPDDPFPASAALGETDSGARNLPGYLCSLLEPGPTLVVGASEVVLRAADSHPVTVVDWNTRRLRALERCALDRGREIRAICRDPTRQDLDLGSRAFANAVCLDVLERCPDEMAILEKVHRALQPGGRLVARVRAGSWVREEPGSLPATIRRYDPESLRSSLEQAGFRTLQIRYWNFVGVPIAFLCDRCLQRPHRDQGGSPASERPRSRWEGGIDAWFRMVENRLGLPVGVSLISVATPYIEKIRVKDPLHEKGFSGKTARTAYEPMATTR
jgi:SAM-dependent methyltransferase